MFRRSILAFALTLPLGTLVNAQGFDWRTVLSQSTKVQMNVNAEFELSKERIVPIHFSVGVPFFKGSLVTQTRFPTKQGNLAEFRFLSPDQKLLEYVTMSVGTVGGDTTEDRVKRIFGVIENQVYPSITPPETAKVLGGRKATIGGQPAVEYLSLFDHPDYGPVAARIVGVLAPNQTDVVFMVQQTMRGTLDINGPDELASTFAGNMFGSITFQAYRDSTGALVDF